MEDKYYVPDISEFHVGFEYERISTTTFRWVKRIFKDGESAEQYCEDGEARVKYLDKEDIESLGWEKYKDSYRIKVDLDTVTHCVLKETSTDFYNISQFRKAPNNISQTIFWGRIENKSELKRLMNQLGING